MEPPVRISVPPLDSNPFPFQSPSPHKRQRTTLETPFPSPQRPKRRDEHEASRGEASESHVRLASWTQSWNRLAESIPWNRLASPRHESKHLGLASTRLRRGELALELASREPTRRLISLTVCYVKIAFWWHAESFAT